MTVDLYDNPLINTTDINPDNQHEAANKINAAFEAVEDQFNNISFTVTWDEVQNKPATATRWPTWSEVTSKPTNFVTTDTSQTINTKKFWNTLENGTFQTNTGSLTRGLEVRSSDNNDAMMTFHIQGRHALHFGLDWDTNDLAIGGWSKGAVAHRIWHAGNSDSFNSSGNYSGLRAQATTKADVGLSGIPNTNASTVNYLRGDGNWVTPPNTTYSEITTAEIDGGTSATLRTITGRRMKHGLDKKADVGHTHNDYVKKAGDTMTGLLSVTSPSSINAPLLDLVATTNDGVDATLLGGSMESNTTNRYFLRFFGGGGAENFSVSTNGTIYTGHMPVVLGAAIVARGSNANGNWTRFADGTQLCSYLISSAGQNTAWDYPASFNSSPYVLGTPYNNNDGNRSVTVDTRTISPSNTSCRVSRHDTSGIRAGPASVIAIGTWK